VDIDPELMTLPLTTHGLNINPLRSKVPLFVKVAPDEIVKMGFPEKSSFKKRVVPELITIEPPESTVDSSIVTLAVTVTTWGLLIVIVPELKSGVFAVVANPPPASSSQVLGSFQLPVCRDLKGFWEKACEKAAKTSITMKNERPEVVIQRSAIAGIVTRPISSSSLPIIAN